MIKNISERICNQNAMGTSNFSIMLMSWEQMIRHIQFILLPIWVTVFEMSWLSIYYTRYILKYIYIRRTCQYLIPKEIHIRYTFSGTTQHTGFMSRLRYGIIVSRLSWVYIASIWNVDDSTAHVHNWTHYHIDKTPEQWPLLLWYVENSL